HHRDGLIMDPHRLAVQVERSLTGEPVRLRPHPLLTSGGLRHTRRARGAERDAANHGLPLSFFLRRPPPVRPGVGAASETLRTTCAADPASRPQRPARPTGRITLTAGYSPATSSRSSVRAGNAGFSGCSRIRSAPSASPSKYTRLNVVSLSRSRRRSEEHTSELQSRENLV